ncbi:MAG: hypothetical protein JRF27_08460 [Deltaproteobacteria bacterium]|nr:hypothetical protein [Deltaproteobacteria bacterium]MBW2193802.1 hypothetical protein [Deltaproteobacteria bacterium]
MNKIVIQIYEVQTPSEAEKLIELGVDHVGSVILSGAEWKIPVLKKTINRIQALNARSSLIPLFSDADLIFRTLDYYRPDIVHFCESITGRGDIDDTMEKLLARQADVRNRFPEIKIMRSIPIPENKTASFATAVELARRFEPTSDYFLTDTLLVDENGTGDAHQPVEGFVGITGKTCSWDTAEKLVESSRIPVILAGGLSPDNVFESILRVQPAGVDSCTGTNVMDTAGRPVRFKKDLEKVKRFVAETHRAERLIGH